MEMFESCGQARARGMKWSAVKSEPAVSNVVPGKSKDLRKVYGRKASANSN